jgi:flagellar motor protein MotB
VVAQVFISHSSKDRKFARTICTALESRGLSCWIASRDVGPGENFMDAIVRAIRAAKVMVLVFSENANNSDEIKREVVLAGNAKVTVIPVRVEDVVPGDAFAYQFATRQWIDLFEDWESQLERLATWIAGVVPVGTAADSVAPKGETVAELQNSMADTPANEANRRRQEAEAERPAEDEAHREKREAEAQRITEERGGQAAELQHGFQPTRRAMLIGGGTIGAGALLTLALIDIRHNVPSPETTTRTSPEASPGSIPAPAHESPPVAPAASAPPTVPDDPLTRYRSDFFGKLRNILGTRPDMRVVGDRFLLQADALFDDGEATLRADERAALDKLAAALRDLESQIPSAIDWVLRVTGYTGAQPISATSQFRSNLELSAARATAVAQYLIGRGDSPQRLVASGLGDAELIDQDTTEEALRRNSRIELKLTQR